MKRSFLVLFLIPATALLAQPQNGNAAGDPINSVQSGDWMNAATWDCSCVPGSTSDVTIQAGHTIALLEGDTAHMEGLSLLAGAALTLPKGARVEMNASLASLGVIEGRGVMAFTGEGNKSCGPADLEHLVCGTTAVTFVDTVSIRSQLDLESAAVATGDMLILEGQSGITTSNGTLTGQVTRRFTWLKESSFNEFYAPSISGTAASSVLGIPGAVYLKQWDETTTGYVELVDEDVIDPNFGFNCSMPAGEYAMNLTGDAVLSASVGLTAQSSSSSWKGWNLAGNPITGYVDLSLVTTTGPGSLGATYHWIDSLETWAAQVGGLGQFGRTSVLAPGDAFFTIVDTNLTVEYSADAIVDKPSGPTLASSGLLALVLETGDRKEECIIEFGTGSADYDRLEDAEFGNAFRGRNNLDIFSESADGVDLMINSTSATATNIPIWVRALNGEEVTLKAGALPSHQCLMIEDVITGWTGAVDEGLDYAFTVGSHLAVHRFNLIVGGGVEATAVDAACASAMDGMVAVVGPDPSSSFSLTDAAGTAVGTFIADSLGGTFTGLMTGTYTVTAVTEGCADLSRTVEVGAGGSGAAPFMVHALPDHIGCYDDHGGVTLAIDGGLEPYTVTWSNGASGATIEVEEPGAFQAVITDAAGCADSTEVEVLAAPQVEAEITVDNPVVTLVDGEAEVHFLNSSNGATAYQWNFGDGGTSTTANPIHQYTAAGAYTVGLNAWNDYCSDTYQMVVTVETVSSVGALGGIADAVLSRVSEGWQVQHAQEAFAVEVFDLTGRMVYRENGAPGQPVMLDPAMLPPVSLVHCKGAVSGHQQTWRVAR